MGDRTTVNTPRGEHGFLLCLILGGIAIRLLWLVQVHGGLTGFLEASEATRVALAIAQRGEIGDAYRIGQGPTAHLPPLNPLVAGGVMWLFGPGSAAANLALLGWSLAQCFAGYLLVRLLFLRLGADPLAVRWGTAFLFLVPPFVQQEVIDFRYWEGGSAMALTALNLLMLLRLDRERTAGLRFMAAIALVWALTLFVSPPAGLALGACWAVVACRRLPFAQAARLAALTAVALALLVGPWTIRNATVLGDPIVLRSNAGLELALANHPAALSGERPEQVFYDRLNAIHPAANAAAMRRVAESGEAAYARALGEQTWRWLRANPAAFVTLWTRHVGEYLFPRPWQMYFTGWPEWREARAFTISLVQLLGLIGLAAALAGRRHGYWTIAAYVALTVLPYGLFQPTVRYIFPLYALLALLAAEAVAGAIRHSARRVATPGTAR